MSTIQRAKEVAFTAHVGQEYGPYPYTKHLNDVYNVLTAFGVTDKLVLMGGWMHDSIEDTHIVYEDVFEEFGKKFADLVYLVTDKRGKNRRERHEKTYPLIAEDARATLIKVADRLANVMNSQHEKEKQFFMYEKEHPYFKKTITANLTELEFDEFRTIILDILTRIDALIEAGPHMEF